MSEKPCSGGISTWTEGLKSNGLHFKGHVDDVNHLLENHRAETVTMHGTRRSRGTSRPILYYKQSFVVSHAQVCFILNCSWETAFLSFNMVSVFIWTRVTMETWLRLVNFMCYSMSHGRGSCCRMSVVLLWLWKKACSVTTNGFNFSSQPGQFVTRHTF